MEVDVRFIRIIKDECREVFTFIYEGRSEDIIINIYQIEYSLIP